MSTPSIFAKGLFSDRVVMVTGGGTGLGRAMAETFAQLGANVALLGRRPDVLNEAAHALSTATRPVLALPTDIREPAAVDDAVQQVVATWGQLDVLINNAGGQFPKAAEDISPRGLDAVVRTNLYGTIYMMQAAARIMRAQGGGAIINVVVSSLDRGIPGVAHTMAARAGVLGFMRTAAQEWGPYNIRLNAIGPGLIETPGFRQEMVQTGDPDVVHRTLEAVPLGRLGQPSDVTSLAVFLASPAAHYMTGEYITVDGGNSLAQGISVLPADRTFNTTDAIRAWRQQKPELFVRKLKNQTGLDS